MNPVVLTLEGLLAVLLALTLLFGIKLERKLKALRKSQEGFLTAVRDLDTAAGRTEAGLDALRYATEGARDVLVQRMEAAQQMALRLESLTDEADSAGKRVEVAVRTVDQSAERAAAVIAAAGAAARAQAAAEAAAALPEPSSPALLSNVHRFADAYAPSSSPEPQPVSVPEPAVSSRLREAAALLRGGRR